MSRRTDFIKQYTNIPDSKGVRNIIFGMWIMVNSINPIQIYGLEIQILKHTFWDMSLHWAVLLLYDIWGLAFVLFTKKLSKYIYIYSATGFAATSLYLLYGANLTVYLESGEKAILFTIISLVVYLLVIVAAIKNIANKMHKGVSNVINTKNAFAVSAAGGALGILFAKLDILRGDFPLAVASLALSCIFILPCTGFHQFYLINKMSKSDKMQDNNATKSQD